MCDQDFNALHTKTFVAIYFEKCPSEAAQLELPSVRGYALELLVSLQTSLLALLSAEGRGDRKGAISGGKAPLQLELQPWPDCQGTN